MMVVVASAQSAQPHKNGVTIHGIAGNKFYARLDALMPTWDPRLNPVMSPTVIPADLYATADFSYLETTVTELSENASVTVAGAVATPNTAKYLYGFCLVLIPTATILGNLLVIMSVLRFKALHSAINFLILGLAVADLLVAVSVMPYAVYIYVQGGAWYLGPLMCDIYSAFDVACSTASILLLAVISFDRYRAVSRPIQYSRQSQNIRRVVGIIIIIWVISLALASPMVLGVNNRPIDASEFECRFYNPEFSIGSSIVSFVIPCFVVLFVYIRIMMALRKREMAARARRQANQASEGNKSYDGSDEAGQIVAGPAVNVMMLALPSMTRRIKSYERQRAAVEEAGEEELLDDEEMEAEGTSGEDEDDSDGGSVFEDPAAATDDSGIGRRRGSSAPVLKKRKKSAKKQPVRGAPSRSLPITASKPAVTSQALCLSSFLPILGTATSAVRRTGSVSPRKLNVMALAAESVDNGILSSKQFIKSPKNVLKKQDVEKRQHPGRSHRSCSDAPLLSSKSPLMLQRFMADTTDTIEQLDVSRLASRSEPLYRRANNTIHDHDLAGSSSPHSSTDSLSENVHVVTNDFVSEGPTSMSRRSSDFDSSFANNTVSSLNSSNLLDKSDRSGMSDEKRYRRGFRQTPGFGRRSFTMPSMGQNTVKRRNTTGLREPFLPNFLRQLSRRSPRIFRRVDAYPCKAYTIGGNHQIAEVIENCDTATPVKKALYRSGEANDDDETDKFLASTTPNGINEVPSARNSQGSSSPNSTLNAIIRRSVTTNDAAEIEDKVRGASDIVCAIVASGSVSAQDQRFEGTTEFCVEDGVNDGIHERVHVADPRRVEEGRKSWTSVWFNLAQFVQYNRMNRGVNPSIVLYKLCQIEPN
uniref:G_PROTEIN_RECEP_F1_2 domain-containing protein n=1 Tax=Panagrellus redivivus TaxID=6233 RepID=A0A7E4W3N4_PANRE